MSRNGSAVKPGYRHLPQTSQELTEQNVKTIARLEEAEHAKRTFGDTVADYVAAFCGSMLFVWVHVTWFGIWIAINIWPHGKHIDRFPFPFLTLVVSLEAIFLTTFVLISQNRQSRIADRRNHLDLQVNLLAEQESSKTLEMLSAIMEKLGISHLDPTVKALEEVTQPEKLVEQIDSELSADSLSTK